VESDPMHTPEPLPAPGAAPDPFGPPEFQPGPAELAGGAARLDVLGAVGEPRARRRTMAAGVSPLERQLLAEAEGSRQREMESVRRELHGLRHLLAITRQISSILDPDALQEAILDSAIQLVLAERGLLLLDLEGKLSVFRGRGRDGQMLDLSSCVISETLARQCLQENRVIPHDDLSRWPDLKEVRSIKALDLYSAVCVPLRERGHPIGVLYLDSSAPGLRCTPKDLALLEAFASNASTSMLNARLMHDLEESRLALRRENQELRAEAKVVSAGNIIGQCPPMRALFDKIALLKDTDIPVLLLGESGTGKELVARALHYEGHRAEGPFVPINCAGLPADLLDSLMFGHRRGAFTGAFQDRPGLVEQANGGTLFLDEVSDMPAAVQVKLLRFLENGEFRRVGENEIRRARLRVLSATNQDLLGMVRSRAFREDLYFRLAGVRLDVPPLRERREDIGSLVEHFLRHAGARLRRTVAGVTEDAMRFIMNHPWPGNVRQLMYAIEGASAFVPDGQNLDETHLRMQLGEPELSPSPAGSFQESMARTEKALLERALLETEWNISRAAKTLGISRQHLHNRIRHHGLKRPT